MLHLTAFINSNLIELDYGGTPIGMLEPTLEELYIIRGYADLEIRLREKQYE